MFDGDDHLPDTIKMEEMIEDMKRQLKIFSGQSSDINKNLKELVGHTPLQVLVGALLGAAVPFVMMVNMK